MINWKCLFKGHRMLWSRNIFGDEIIGRNYKRTELKCSRCNHSIHIHDFLIPTRRGELLEEIENLTIKKGRKKNAK